jgi:hypothetical protein
MVTQTTTATPTTIVPPPATSKTTNTVQKTTPIITITATSTPIQIIVTVTQQSTTLITTSTSTFPTLVLISTSGAPGTAVPISAPTSSTTPAASSNQSSKRLSLGLGIGLGVGIPLLGLLSLCCCFFVPGYLDRHRRRQQPDWEARSDAAGGAGGYYGRNSARSSWSNAAAWWKGLRSSRNGGVSDGNGRTPTPHAMMAGGTGGVGGAHGVETTTAELVAGGALTGLHQGTSNQPQNTYQNLPGQPLGGQAGGYHGPNGMGYHEMDPSNTRYEMPTTRSPHVGANVMPVAGQSFVPVPAGVDLVGAGYGRDLPRGYHPQQGQGMAPSDPFQQGIDVQDPFHNPNPVIVSHHLRGTSSDTSPIQPQNPFGIPPGGGMSPNIPVVHPRGSVSSFGGGNSSSGAAGSSSAAGGYGAGGATRGFEGGIRQVSRSPESNEEDTWRNGYQQP